MRQNPLGRYANIAIGVTLTIRMALHLPRRQTEGFLVERLIALALPPCSYRSTIEWLWQSGFCIRSMVENAVYRSLTIIGRGTRSLTLEVQ